LRLRSLIEAGFNNFDAAEQDIKQALSLEPSNVNIILNYANLLWKTNRKQEAFQTYNRALGHDATNHAALTAMGYRAREVAGARANIISRAPAVSDHLQTLATTSWSNSLALQKRPVISLTIGFY